MRIVAIENLQPGMQLARTLYSDDGRVLLHSKVQLTQGIIKRIQAFHYNFLYIRDPGDPVDDEFSEPVKAETKAKAVSIVKETMASLEKSISVNVERLKNVVSDMVDQILSDKQMVYNMVDIRTHDDYTFSHSVNVGILALLTGSALGYSRNDLEHLGMGAILHDIGKIFIPSALLNKPERLEPEEYETIKEHTHRGYDLLKDRNVSYVAAHLALEHHEREDGSGYPRGLNSPHIHRYAKIVAVADVFDAMTSNRVYRNAIPTHLVLKELQESSVKKFSKSVVDCVVKIIAPYPVGSVLRLSNGETATVVKVTKKVCMVKPENIHGEGVLYDLYNNNGLTVDEVIPS